LLLKEGEQVLDPRIWIRTKMSRIRNTAKSIVKHSDDRRHWDNGIIKNNSYANVKLTATHTYQFGGFFDGFVPLSCSNTELDDILLHDGHVLSQQQITT
jgi:hypothetical protein